MATIVLDNVSKVYPNGFRAVDCANLEIRDREFVVLVGPSGCGKSTTLRMIAGLDDVSSGNIYIDGQRVNDLAPRDRDLAMVFQNYALYPHLTAYENMAFGLRLRKHSSAEIDSRVNDAARILGISADQLQRKPKALSGGQRQRIAVGRAIVRQPRAFLFDEPLSNLDAKTRVEMRAEISKLHNRLESTILYVTHDQVEAMTMGDRIVVIRDGVIQQVDDPIALYDNPKNAFVAGFIGSPPMNLFRGTIRKRDKQLWFVEQSRDKVDGFSVQAGPEVSEKLATLIDREVLLGCRPENVILRPSVPADPSLYSLRATVEIVEPMGAETHLYLTTGIQSFVVRSQERHVTTPGDVLHFAFNTAKCHFFDAATEMAIA